MRSIAAMAALTALFVGTLVGGLRYTGALDPAMLRGPQEDHPGSGRAGWKTHSLPSEGFSIQLPPEWEGAPEAGKVVFRAMDGKKVVASLTVVRSDDGLRQTQSATMKGFVRGQHVLTFTTTQRLAASYARVFEEAANSFRELRKAA
jgi:hypothetical protein